MTWIHPIHTYQPQYACTFHTEFAQRRLLWAAERQTHRCRSSGISNIITVYDNSRLENKLPSLKSLLNIKKCQNCIKIFLRNLKWKLTEKCWCNQIRAEGLFAFATPGKAHMDNLHMDRARVPTTVWTTQVKNRYTERWKENETKEMYHTAVTVIWSWGNVTFERADKAYIDTAEQATKWELYNNMLLCSRCHQTYSSKHK